MVVYIQADGYGVQGAIYNDAVWKYRYQTYWLALIDLDEFLVPVEKTSMYEVLIDFEKYPGVALNWVCFDTNGHKTKPTQHGGLVTANYTRVNKDYNIGMNRHIKSIVNPRKVQYVINPHCSKYTDGYAVTENFDSVSGAFTKYHSSNKIRINHYFTKSQEEYLSRDAMRQQFARFGRISNVQKHWQFEQDFEESTNDVAIQKYLPKLKIVMGILD